MGEKINGLQCAWGCFWDSAAEGVAPGERVEVDISFYLEPFKNNGITEYTDIEIPFCVQDANMYSLAEETVHIYPYGEEKAYTYVREPQSTDIVLYDGDEATILATGFMEDGVWGYTVNLYLENKTDSNLYFEVPSSSVDGIEHDAFVPEERIFANNVMFAEVCWDSVTKAEEIELEFKLRNDLFKEIASDTVTLNP